MNDAGGGSLIHVIRALVAGGARRIFAKPLAANDNSKNQVYLGGDFGVLNTIPAGNPTVKATGSHAKPIFEAALNLSWLGANGRFYPAPHSKLILYPQYPEVRLSGFLLGCQDAPSELMGKTRVPGRLLILGVRDDGAILAWVGAPDSPANREFLDGASTGRYERNGVFHQVPLPEFGAESDRDALLRELRRICREGWVDSHRLGPHGERLPCEAPNCGGFTLEAELGITPNGYSEPDFRGWEVKQHAVRTFGSLASGPITLMTPEPTGGVYASRGVIPFLRAYGYADRVGRADRRNFGGIHRAGAACRLTGLTLTLLGYDQKSGRITDASGGIALLDAEGREAAAWPFAGLMAHWNRKHARAAYLPSVKRDAPARQYRYGPEVRLGVGTDFLRFLGAVAAGAIYYDPGIKAESWSSNPVVKRRSQFRIKSMDIPALYQSVEAVNLA